MQVNNLKLWNSVEKTNPKYTKKAKIGGMSITAIAPQYQIMMVTEQFGVYGQTWGFKNIEQLWNSVEKTNPKYTKKAKIGGMSITAIAPQYQIMMVTEQFGVYGQTWGFKNIELDYSLVKYDMVVFKGTFFFPEGEFEIINSCKLYINNAKTMLDDNFAKKIETDTLTKAISKLGFNADIFMGKFDDVRYLAEITKEFAPKPIKQPLSDERFTKALIALKDGKITKESLNAYALTSEQVKTLAK